ncbi:hypothetical protein AB0M92_19285 [Streptomyces sp. NPDC051582]|uniref:hypothetical protein n=1 Tax=Streptomyces sp. NPDC051582 TaxID=3155167 RepID=UPI0034366E1C
MSTDPPTPVDADVSIARLHGEACWDCGAVGTTLHPAGAVTLPGGQVWEIRKCVNHRDLTELQERGRACVHCGVILDNGSAIQLPARLVTRGGHLTSWLPRACPPHGALP